MMHTEEPKAAAMLSVNPERQIHHKAFLLAPPDSKHGRTFASHIRWDKLCQFLSLSNEY